MTTPPSDCSVLIVGGGPCGLMLANELGRRGVTAILVDQKSTTAFNPQANATQARTMEHFRRLGIAGEIRALGLPPDFPTDIAYFTRYAKYELARFKLPSAREAVERVKQLSGSWSAAELPHRVSQKFVEQVLRRHAEALSGVSVHYGWRLTGFSETADGIEADIERVSDGKAHRIRSAFLVGADGPRSTVRQALGFQYTGEEGAVRDFFGGRMFAIYLRAPEFYQAVPHPPAWMNVTFNHERRAFMAAVDGKGEFAFHTQLRPHEVEGEITRERALAMFQEAVGAPIQAEILSQGTWIAGYALVADRFQRGRAFIAGDAAHLFTPAGGLGYNTAIEDAVNLGWKLAATIRGSGGPTERQTQHGLRAAVCRLAGNVRASPGDRERDIRRCGSTPPGRQLSRGARQGRVQHSRNHLRRTMLHLAHHGFGRNGTAARCGQPVCSLRLPRRTRTSFVAVPRAIPLRPLRL